MSKLKLPDPSTKNGRRSEKNVSNPLRFTTAGSASTWPKSGLTVPVSVRPAPSLYFRSKPTLALSSGDFAGAVPPAFAVAVVEPVAILLDAGRIHRKLERGAAVVIRVDQDANPIRRRVVVAAGEQSSDARALRLERTHRDVERRRIEG